MKQPGKSSVKPFNFERKDEKIMKKHKFQTIGTNAIDPAAPASVWGKGVPGKGGATTNFSIPEWMFERELHEMINGKSGE